MRARQLEIIQERVLRWSFMRINQLGWRHSEPAEPDRSEEPELFHDVLRNLPRRLGISYSKVASDLGWSMAMLEEVAGIDLPTTLPPNVVSLRTR